MPVKLFVLIILFIPPALLTSYWYLVEYDEYYPFSNLQIRGLENITHDQLSAIHDLTGAMYESTKDDFLVRFKKEEEISEFSEFNKNVSKSITEQLGIFSSLPYHEVCLFNKNQIYIDNQLDIEQEAHIGGAAVRQENGYQFYAPRNGVDCKIILIDKFRQSSTSPDLGYPIVEVLTQEENQKRLRGQEYVVSLATTTVVAQHTFVRISLNPLTVLAAYFLLLFAWSFIFFQYQKIFQFVVTNRNKY